MALGYYYNHDGCYIGTETEREAVVWHCDFGEVDIADEILKLFDEYKEATTENDRLRTNERIHQTFDQALYLAVN